MNIDQRLEARAERHEALTQTVELIAVMQRDNEKRMVSLTAAVQMDAENIRALARIAEIHERRLTDIEGPQQ